MSFQQHYENETSNGDFEFLKKRVDQLESKVDFIAKSFIATTILDVVFVILVIVIFSNL